MFNCPFCLSANMDLPEREAPDDLVECLCNHCARSFYVKRSDLLTDRYVAWGYNDGWCGHYHPTRIEAEECRAAFSAEKRRVRKYSDRAIIIVCNCKDQMELPQTLRGKDGYPRCAYCRKRVITP